MIKNILIKTTAATAIDCSHIEKITGIVIDSAEPDNTKTRYLVSIDGGKWRRFNNGAWSFVSEQELTADSVLQEGNTKDELTSLREDALAAFEGKIVDVAIAMSVENHAEMPSISKFKIIGKNSQIKKDIIFSDVIELSEDPIDITGIEVTKIENNGGAVEVYASVKNGVDEWSEYTRYDKIKTKAKAIRFKAEIEVDKPGISTAILNDVKVHHWQSGKSAATEGKSVLITKPVSLENEVSRAHALVRHPKVIDTEFNVSIIFGGSNDFKDMTLVASYEKDGEVEDEYEFIATDNITSKTATLKVEIVQKSGTVVEQLLGAGTGKQQAFKLDHHVRSGTLSVLGSDEWVFKEKTNTLLVTAKAGDEIFVSYDWIAETTYITALACIFNS